LSRSFLAALFIATAAAAAPPLSPRQQGEDFDAMWRAVDRGYAYFEGGHGAWKRARQAWRPRAARATSHDDFVAALEGALAELRDDHVSLSEHAAASARRVPFDTDIWARWKNGAAVVEAVRTFGDADVAGLKPGHVVTRVNGIALDPAAGDWALRHVLAGPRAGTQRVAVREGTRVSTLEIERRDAPNGMGPAIIARRMGDERDIGYLRVRIGAPDDQFTSHLDGALHQLRDMRALIVDLRENAGPGSRAVTRAVLSRFVEKETPWQIREAPGGARSVDSIAPRGSAPYRAPVAVLVDRWTAGEGEALAAGLKAVARAHIIGTETAGLRGELREVTLPHSGIAVRFPAEKTLQVDGQPRDTLKPTLLVDLAAPSGGPGDPILYQALKVFEKR
jgi:carboxyl-terminal processing protease